MELDYRIDTDEVLPTLQILENVYIDLAQLPDSPELEEFCADFHKAMELIKKNAEAMGFSPEEALGYFKVKAYLEIADTHVTITKDEYDKLKEDSDRLQGLLY